MTTVEQSSSRFTVVSAVVSSRDTSSRWMHFKLSPTTVPQLHAQVNWLFYRYAKA